jgi:hypothetical protein
MLLLFAFFSWSCLLSAIIAYYVVCSVNDKVFHPFLASCKWDGGWVKTYYSGPFQARKCTCFLVHFVLFKGHFFKISCSVLKNTKNGFLKQILPHNFCYLLNDSVFSKIFYLFTHLCLFQWKTSSRCVLCNHMKWNSSYRIEMEQWTHM